MSGSDGPLTALSCNGRREDGMVTAETAVVLPVLAAVALTLVWLLSLGIAQVRCVDAAREAARLAARGDLDSATAVASAAGPQGAVVDMTRGGGVVRVTVSVAARPDLPLLGHLPAVVLTASAVSAEEGADAP